MLIFSSVLVSCGDTQAYKEDVSTEPKTDIEETQAKEQGSDSNSPPTVSQNTISSAKSSTPTDKEEDIAPLFRWIKNRKANKTTNLFPACSYVDPAAMGCGYINKKGEMVIQPQYMIANKFS